MAATQLAPACSSACSRHLACLLRQRAIERVVGEASAWAVGVERQGCSRLTLGGQPCPLLAPPVEVAQQQAPRCAAPPLPVLELQRQRAGLVLGKCTGAGGSHDPQPPHGCFLYSPVAGKRAGPAVVRGGQTAAGGEGDEPPASRAGSSRWAARQTACSRQAQRSQLVAVHSQLQQAGHGTRLTPLLHESSSGGKAVGGGRCRENAGRRHAGPGATPVL